MLKGAQGAQQPKERVLLQATGQLSTFGGWEESRMVSVPSIC